MAYQPTASWYFASRHTHLNCQAWRLNVRLEQNKTADNVWLSAVSLYLSLLYEWSVWDPNHNVNSLIISILTVAAFQVHLILHVDISPFYSLALPSICKGNKKVRTQDELFIIFILWNAKTYFLLECVCPSLSCFHRSFLGQIYSNMSYRFA